MVAVVILLNGGNLLVFVIDSHAECTMRFFRSMGKLNELFIRGFSYKERSRRRRRRGKEIGISYGIDVGLDETL